MVKISPAELLKAKTEDVASCMATIGFLIWNTSQTSGSVEPAGLPMQSLPLRIMCCGKQDIMHALCGSQIKGAYKGI